MWQHRLVVPDQGETWRRQCSRHKEKIGVSSNAQLVSHHTVLPKKKDPLTSDKQ